jgi:hypothetical protein
MKQRELSKEIFRRTAAMQGGFKKASVTGRGRLRPRKHCFAKAIRGRGRPRPFLESTQGIKTLRDRKSTVISFLEFWCLSGHAE